MTRRVQLWFGPISAIVFTFLVASSFVFCFKEEEFKKCDDANFCKRNRGRAGDVYALQPETAKLQGSVLSATVLNEETEPPVQFKLQVTFYNSFLRVHLNEMPDKGRYQVSGVLSEDMEKHLTGARLDIGKDALTATFGDAQIVIKYWPLQMDVYVGQKRAIVLNSRQMLGMEHMREKKEGDPEGWWEEKFRSHTDSKPNGPEAVSFDVMFDDFKHVYGLPERATSLALKPTAGSGVSSEPYRLYNLDVFEYLPESPFGLYGSIPMMVAHRKDLTVGVFWLNSAEMFVDVMQSGGSMATQWIAESGVLDLFLMLGPTPPDVMRQYASITGATAMPQLFSLGYHQCRWNYNDEKDVAQVDAGFDQHFMPYDVLWLDIEHTVGKRYMTWDSSKFPNPEDMQEDVASRGRKMVVIVDPHVKRDDNFPMHKDAQEHGYYVRNKDNNTFDGWCWPGSSSYLDMMNPEIRNWWAKHFLLEHYPGSTKHLYIWNDMNEPSVFNGPEVTMPKDNIHWSPDGDVEHRDVHNAYGMFYHKATADGLKLRGDHIYGADSDRPFVLSRAFFAGTQTIGPIWTGDNTADWNQLGVSVPMLLSLGLAGLTNSGADVGGFFGNPDPELLTRWYQLGAFYPFFRGHAHLETKRREPWLFGEPWTSRIRSALRLRYQMLPTTYTLFRAANLTGEPVMRPMWYTFPEDEESFSEDKQFMFGPGVMVRPVLEAGAQDVELYLPQGPLWYDFWDGSLVQAPSGWLGGSKSRFRVPVTIERIPVYIKGGSIIVRRDRERRSTAAMAEDPVTIVVALDSEGKASGDLYMDDGRSFAFRRGKHIHRVFEYSNGELKSRAAGSTGGMESAVEVERIVVLGLPGGPGSWHAEEMRPRPSLLHVAPGPILMEPGVPSNALVIRKPGLRVGEDFSVALMQKA